MDTALIMIGVACIIAGIIGGGVKLVQVELGPVASLWRQMLLAVFGIILVIWGLVAGGHDGLTGPAAPSSNSAGKDDSLAPDAGIATPRPPVASTPPAANAPAEVALPAKVDIFWCEREDGTAANAALAQKIGPALSATGKIGQVRLRELRLMTNSQPDYQIHADIVRFDPGERPAAEAIAQIASKASDTAFAPAPALPGTPSVNYLSVFVCAER